jgi:hypothetical protein
MTSRFLSIATLCVLTILALAGCTGTRTGSAAPSYVEPQPPPEFEFYELNDYGEWLDVYPQGPVWRPYAAQSWRPYLHGHWVWSEWGWTWVSYEPFGWAVYHYGYWRFSSLWGWVWIPGYEWAPVRVQWVYYDDYVCWAPIPPPGYDLPDPWEAQSTELWVVVHPRDFLQNDLELYRVDPPRYKDHYLSGVTVSREPPQRPTIERLTHETVPYVQLKVRKYPSATKTFNKVVLPEKQKEIIRKYKQPEKSTTTGREKPQQKQKTKSTPRKKDTG